MRKSINDKGSALITVIVAMAIVGILAVVALWISLINYQMKITDEDVKDNFYSAESVLDEICVGLQDEVSQAYDKAYTNVMQTYSALSEEDRKDQFSKEYVFNLRRLIHSDENGGSDLRYSMDKIRSYVDPTILDQSTYPYAVIESTTAESGGQDGLLNVYESGLSIKGLRVSFTDEKGYNSIIETDIRLNIPDMNFLTSVEMPDTFSFSIIGNRGLEFKTGIANVAGSVYAGSPYALDSEDDDMQSILFDKGAITKFTNGKYLISEGVFNIDTVAEVSVSPETQLWTDNILVNGSLLNLPGNTYVADDLTMTGLTPKVVLGKNGAGRYFGFGDDDTVAGNSSAIILNGKNSSLNMSGLDELFVAGYSFIQTSAIQSDLLDNEDVRMGESISLKGNQIAYLVPGECIGVDNYGESVYGRNPITYSEFSKIYASGTYDLYNGSIVSSKTGHPLSYYLDDGETLEDCITTVFVPASSGVEDDILVYFYLSLSKDNAARYYNDFYDKSSEKLETYADFYADVILSKDSNARVYTAGNYSLYKEKKLSLLAGSKDNVSSEITQVDHTYRALISTLTTNYDKYVAGELDKTVFENIVNITKLREVTNVTGLGKKVVTYSGEDGAEYTAVVIDNIDDNPYVINTENQEGGLIRLVIATGDVDVQCDYTGTIISQGKISVKGSHNIKNEDIENMKKLLTVALDEKADIHLYDLFNNGNSYLVSSIIGGEEAVDDSKISYTDIITYENWTKK